ncbi:MAG: metallophosphoesterase family protein [Brevinematia bacterium]
MLIAIFSDIHSNLEAFEVFLNQTYGRVDIYICLGDVIGYGPDPSACLGILKKLCGTEYVLRGNHERAIIDKRELKHFNYVAAEAAMWTILNLSQNEIEYIKEWSDVIEFDDFTFVHGSILDPDEYIVSKNRAIANINKLKQLNKKILFFGHTHLPIIWTEEGAYHPENNEKIELNKDKTLLINPGSIGQPRDNNPLGSYIIFDTKEYSVTFKRFEYDIDKTYRKIIDRGLPEYLGKRLFYGI